MAPWRPAPSRSSRLGGLAGGYLAALISRWPMIVWVVAAVGAIDNYLTAEMFANPMTLFLPCLIAVVGGAWVGGRLPRPAAAIAA
jgi:mannitol-specific phosphotransferase system IIBC component